MLTEKIPNMRFTKLLMSIEFAAILSLHCSCQEFWCGLGSPTSEIIHYAGRIVVEGDSVVNTNIDIWAENLDYELKTFGSKPIHPDSKGLFTVGLTTSSHSSCSTVEQWECGPLRFLIEGDGYETYRGSLSNDELMQLQQNDDGEWLLPDIAIVKQ